MLGATSTAPLIGSGLANFLGFTIKKFKPNTIITWTKTLFLISLSLTLVQNAYLLIAMRFIMGICLGFEFPVVTSVIYEVTPKKIQVKVGNLISIMFSAGLMLGFALCALVTLEKITWKHYFIIIIGIAVIDTAIIFFYLKKEIGVYFMYEHSYPNSKI